MEENLDFLISGEELLEAANMAVERGYVYKYTNKHTDNGWFDKDGNKLPKGVFSNFIKEFRDKNK